MIVIAALRLCSFRPLGLSTDPTLLEAEFISWTTAETNYSIISATIPILRPLVISLSTHYDGGFGHSDGSAYADGSTGGYARSCSQAIPMQYL